MNGCRKLIVGFLLFMLFLLVVCRIFYTLFRIDVLYVICVARDSATVFIVFALLSELVRAIRLSMIYREIIGFKEDWLTLYKRSIIARFSSNVVSTITPSAMGGEFVRGLVIASLKKDLIPVAVAVGLADGLYDLFTNVCLAALLLPLVKPFYSGLVILLIGAFSSLLWILTLLFVKKRFKLHFLRKIPFINHPAIVKSGKALVKSFSKDIFIKSFMTSIFGWILVSIGYYYLVEVTCTNGRNLLDVATDLIYAFLLGIVPTPAGLVTMDIWLASTTCPEAAILWRTSGLMLVLIMGLVSLPQVVRVLKEYTSS